MKTRTKGGWGWKLKRWCAKLGLLVCFLAVISAVGAGVIENLPSWPGNPYSGLWQGLLSLLGLNCVGTLLAMLLVHTADSYYFWFTPITMPQYLRRNFRRIAALPIFIYLVLPVCMALALPDEYRRNRLFMGNLLLIYALSLLVPQRELVGSRRSPATFYFPLRSILVSGIPVTLFYFGCLISVQVFRSIPLEWVNRFNAWFVGFDHSLIAHLFVLVVSPFSELVFVVHSEYAVPILSGALVWHGVVAFCCVRDFVEFARKGDAQRDFETLEQWLEERPQVEERMEREDEVREQEMKDQERERNTFHADIGEAFDLAPSEARDDEAGGIPYDSSLSSEAQATRHFDYFKKLPSIFQIRPIARVVARIPLMKSSWVRTEGLYLSLLVVAFAVYLVYWGDRERQGGCGWGTIIVFWCVTQVRPFRLRWLLVSGLTLPLRWPQLIWGDFRHRLRRCLIADAAAALILTLLLQAPIGFAVMWWFFFRLAALNAYAMTTLQSFHKAGRPWPLRLATTFACIVRLVQFGISSASLLDVTEPSFRGFSFAEKLLFAGALLGLEALCLAATLVAACLVARRFGSAHPGNLQWPPSSLSGESPQGVESVAL